MVVDGGAAITLANAAGRGATWNRDGIILFSPRPGSPILRISSNGGETTAVTHLESGQQTNHWGPNFLPDGRHFLYLVTGSPETSGIYVGDLGGSSRRLLAASETDSAAVYASSGQLLFLRSGSLFGQTLDLGQLVLSGSPVLIAEHVLGNGENPAISASIAGPIVYRSGHHPA
jgi:hypothetical protein